jgi:hypothetical protein
MKRYSKASPDSSDAIAKKTKELLNTYKPEKITKVSNIESGLENPCVFGKHNPDFENQ